MADCRHDLRDPGHGPYYTFLTLHLEDLGYSRGVIGLLWALGVVAEVLMFLAMRRILLKFSVHRVLMFSFALAALRCLLLCAAWLETRGVACDQSRLGQLSACAGPWQREVVGARISLALVLNQAAWPPSDKPLL